MKATIISLLYAAAAIAATTPQFITLLTFPDGISPASAPVQGPDGNLYGTTAGPVPYAGSIFRLSSQGLTTIYQFCSLPKCADGNTPAGQLLLGSDGNFYGTTTQGGANHIGTVFKCSPGGTLTTLHSFDQKDGALPTAGLVEANNGVFLGTTPGGGTHNQGTIFSITSAGVFTTLYNFCSQSNCIDGNLPQGPLVQAENGAFYGTTMYGGAPGPAGSGTVFQITMAGVLTTLHSFNGMDGGDPVAGLIQATDNDLYGTTIAGGPQGFGGTVFKITTGGTLTVLYNFPQQRDGVEPYAPLVEANNGKFFGTTSAGGTNGGNGLIYDITSAGAFSGLYSFSSSNGHTFSGLYQGTNGIFYGSTVPGAGGGSVYSLSLGLPPLIKPVPLSGPVGSAVMILGTNLSFATSVTFNGVAAAFTIVSGSEITTTVPVGATTGPIQVTTPSGTLSNVGRFIVTP